MADFLRSHGATVVEPSGDRALRLLAEHALGLPPQSRVASFRRGEEPVAGDSGGKQGDVMRRRCAERLASER